MNDHWNEEQIRHALAYVGYGSAQSDVQDSVIRGVIMELKGMPESREIRTLRYRLKQANRELGKAGHRIYELRCQLAEVRSMSRVDRGSYRSLLQELRELRQQLQQLQERQHADVDAGV